MTTSFETVDHRQLALDQEICPDVKSHRTGRMAAGLNFQDVEFTPGIYIYCDISTGKKARPLVPQNHRLSIIRMFHMMHHPAKGETIKRIADRYYWPGMKVDITDYVNSCQGCNVAKPKRTIQPTLEPRPVFPQRFQDLQIDLVGPLTPSRGMRYILTIVCRTSRWLECLPLAEASASECCDKFIQHWVKNYGIPSKITSDNGVSFQAKMWKDINERLGTIVTYSPIYSPASVGAIERQHGDLKNSLKAVLSTTADVYGSTWVDILP